MYVFDGRTIEPLNAFVLLTKPCPPQNGDEDTTVIRALSRALPAVARIYALPSQRPVTTPLSDTETTVLSEELQVTNAPLTGR